MILLSLALWIVTLIAPAGPRICPAGAFLQHDMAGVYEMTTMRLTVDGCGASQLDWLNYYGEHQALYYSDSRLAGGGVIAWGIQPDPILNAYLDSSQVLGIKPAEPGWIQVATFTPGGQEIQQIYRLRKVATWPASFISPTHLVSISA